MNTDMNQYSGNVCMGMLINYCKKNDSLSAESLVLGKLARHLCLQSTFLVYTYVCNIYIVRESSLSSVGTFLSNVVGVKCQPFLKIVTTGKGL